MSSTESSGPERPSFFGNWGAELNDKEFAEAVAGAGLSPSSVPEDRDAAIRWAAPLHRSELPRASVARKRWLDARATRTQARLEVGDAGPLELPWLDLQWIVKTLSSTADGVYVLREEPDVPVRAQWPLRIATPADEWPSYLYREVESHSWLQPLIKLTGAAQTSDCELLLVGDDPEGALQKVRSLRHIRADAVILMTTSSLTTAELQTTAAAFRDAVDGAGFVLLPRAPQLDWLSSFVMNLAHDQTLDVALRPLGAVLICSRTLANARLSTFVRRMGEALRESTAGEERIPTDLAQRLRAASPMIRDVGDALLAFASSYDYEREIYGATDAVNAVALVETALGAHLEIPPLQPLARGQRAKPPGLPMTAAEPPQLPMEDRRTRADAGEGMDEPPAMSRSGGGPADRMDAERGSAGAYRPQSRGIPEPRAAGRAPAGPEAKVPRDRYVNGRLYDDETATQPADTVEPQSTIFLAINIAEPRAGWARPRGILPEWLLPKSKKGHDLTVAVVELRDGARTQLNEPALRTIHLPNSGESTTATFPLTTRERGRLIARVVVLHRGRVLQTLVMNARIGMPAERMTLVEETVVTPGFATLDGRQEFDAALVVNDHDDGTPGIIPITRDTVGFLEPVQLREAIADVEKTIALLTTLPDKEVDLEDDFVRGVLVQLACQGKLMWDSISRYVAPKFGEATRLQVVEARSGAYLPIEIFYTSYAPDNDAKICAEGVAALRNGKAHHCGHAEDRGYVCPASFWGLSKVIERRAHTTIAQGFEYALSEPKGRRRKLALFRCAAVAASERVAAGDLTGPDGVIASLKKLIKSVYRAENWKSWTATIKKYSPSMLILFPHSEDRDDRNGAFLEIGNEELLSARLEMDYVRDRDHEPGPLVFLLGCNTELTRVAFQNFVERFRDKGAAVVVGTLSPIRGRHATRFVKQFVSLLKSRSGKKGTALGDVLLDVKRSMLAGGDPFALTLVAYGDADWQI